MLKFKRFLVCILFLNSFMFFSSCSSKEATASESTGVLKIDDKVQHLDTFDYYNISNDDGIIKLYATLEKKYVLDAVQNMKY